MTAEQAFNASMNTYPSLYIATTLKHAKFKYFDHVFNVIGNGYRDQEEFLEYHTINKKNKPFLDNFPEKYIGSTQLYQGYTKIDKSFNMPFAMPNFETRINELLTKEELSQRPEIVYSTKLNKKEKISPYPNFQKKYSLIWKCDLNILDKSWIEEAVNFYKTCQKFFNSKNVNSYSNAVPINNEDWKERIENYESLFKQYKIANITEKEYFDKITKAYEIPYDGYIKKFINARWQKESNRINSFINETIIFLEENLEKRNEQIVEKKLKM